MNSNTFDVLIWAHSDQQGGTEMSCAILKALKIARPHQKVGILTPRTRVVNEFFRYEAINVDENAIIETREFLALVVEGGKVDAQATYNRLRNPPFTDLENAIEVEKNKIGSWCHENTLIISCGESVALRVASDLKLKGIIVTDHLLTCTVRWVLEHGGLLDRGMAELLTKFESYDRMAREAFLSPLEFASREYEDYLSHGGVRCIPIGGLFYEPANRANLAGLEPYNRLREASGDRPVVFVFGGGGAVWFQLFARMHKQAPTQINNTNYTLLLPNVVTNDEGKWERDRLRRFTLYRPDGSVETLEDPGRLMYWYAACQLVVLRGGLAAQQVLAQMLSDLEQVPQMLFIEQPGHPQIEHERLSLYNLGFAYSRTFANFDNNQFGVIEAILADIQNNPNLKYRVSVRYGKEMMKELTKCLIIP